MRTFAALVLLGSSSVVCAQETTMRSFLRLNAAGKLRTPEGRAILAEEAVSWPASFGSIEKKPDRIVKVDQDFAVARVESLRTPSQPPIDLYFYLRRTSGNWKVVTFRTLALSGIVYHVRDDLRKRKDLSREERITLLNTELTLSSDRELRLYFKAHRQLLESLASHTTTNAKLGLKRDLERSGFTTAKEEGGIVRLTIGGVLDNTVGFLKVRKGSPPRISPSETIWLEPLGDGWYLFKTT